MHPLTHPLPVTAHVSLLDKNSLTPARATNSGLENTKKPDYQSGFFVPVVRLYFRFFPFI